MTGPDPQRAPARIVLRPIASPLALGFVGLAMATFALAGLEIGWIPSTERLLVGVIILSTGPPLQFAASVWGFLGRDESAATGMGTLGAVWTCIGVVMLANPHPTSAALGTLLLVGAGALAISVVTALQSKVVVAAVMAATAARWIVTALYQLTADPGLKHAAGAVGIALMLAGLYGAAALELEDVKRRAVLPTGRRGIGADALSGRIDPQLDRLSSEAGVREQL